ncbi:ImmA/IrrE family metallo-endopeptidase [Thiobacillus denitrificans]|uniref:ImmA/IrrE family metallo-endopeptidase n=1 Tax=Thiobacillus denitrificans TaxID=36861 RepID=UPI000378C426|nr:ImmA/IrrE family metallo-endopeptidase [Thiobacillus denitrificans]
MTDHRALSKGELILKRFGIDSPEQIDLEAIAFDLGAKVRYRKIDGSEARIVGNGASAIITVNENHKPTRQRFSIAHELGHWVERHGKGGFVCTKEDISPQNDAAKSAEAIANGFASQLILPSYLFDSIAAGMPITLDSADKIRMDFKAGLTTTALKLVKGTGKTAAIVCHGLQGRQWFALSPGWPEYLRLAAELNYETEAFELLYAADKRGKTTLRQEAASRWISGRQGQELKVRSQSVKLADGVVLSVIAVT